MQRFFCTSPLTIDMTISDSAFVHQISRVLRTRVGDTIILFSGDGLEYMYAVQRIEKNAIYLRWLSQTKNLNDPLTHIHLYQALPNKYEKIEYIIEKGVEVGIASFTFFRSDFSQKLAVTSQKISRFQAIAREALEQCGGSRFPRITFLDSYDFRNWLSYPSLTLHTNVQKLNQYLPFSHEIGLFVWPEGGWSEREIWEMCKSGSITVQFWWRILRTETAASVVAFSLLHVQEFQHLIS